MVYAVRGKNLARNFGLLDRGPRQCVNSGQKRLEVLRIQMRFIGHFILLPELVEILETLFLPF